MPLLQAALNGSRALGEHPWLPLTTDELVREALAAVDAGAGAIHLHPRDTAGVEQLTGVVINQTVAAVRAACGVPVGVSTGAWIVPDLATRLALIAE